MASTITTVSLLGKCLLLAFYLEPGIFCLFFLVKLLKLCQIGCTPLVNNNVQSLTSDSEWVWLLGHSNIFSFVVLSHSSVAFGWIFLVIPTLNHDQFLSLCRWNALAQNDATTTMLYSGEGFLRETETAVLDFCYYCFELLFWIMNYYYLKNKKISLLTSLLQSPALWNVCGVVL